MNGNYLTEERHLTHLSNMDALSDWDQELNSLMEL
jgi:hypothetical protein